MCIITGHTSVTATSAPWREREQWAGRFASHVVKSVFSSLGLTSKEEKGEPDPQSSVLLWEPRRGAALCSM